MKVTYVDPSIEFLTIALKSQEIGGEWLTDVNLLNKGLKMIVVSLKWEMALLVREMASKSFIT